MCDRLTRSKTQTHRSCHNVARQRLISHKKKINHSFQVSRARARADDSPGRDNNNVAAVVKRAPIKKRERARACVMGSVSLLRDLSNKDNLCECVCVWSRVCASSNTPVMTSRPDNRGSSSSSSFRF